MIRIVIAEEQQMLLGTIGSLLNLEEDMEVVGQASGREEAMTLLHQLKPDVLIMDIELSGKGNFVTAEELHALDCKVIILATFARKGFVQQALNAGIRGYLLKDSPSEKLATSIRNVMAGMVIFEPELMEETRSEETSLADKIDKKLGFLNYLTMMVNKMKFPILNHKAKKSA